MFNWFQSSNKRKAYRAATYKRNCVIPCTDGCLRLERKLVRGDDNKIKFTAPATIDARDYCPPTSDQHDSPMCAAYTAAHWLSNINWRLTDKLLIYDPKFIYTEAKKLDGFPDRDGTSLVAVLNVIKDVMVEFSGDKQIAIISQIDCENTIKYAIHKFGAVLAAFNITTEWYTCSADSPVIEGKDESNFIGGHAVLICGYNRKGVIIQNSWGEDFGAYGYATITWEEFRREFQYGAVLTNCLDGMSLPNAL